MVMVRWLALALLIPATAPGHDFWLEPSTFRPAPGQIFTIGLRVGRDFAGDEIPVSAELIDSFAIRDGAGERAIDGYARILKSNGAVIGYRSKPYPLELPAEKYNEFLQQEGFAMRVTQPQREHFSRFAKALIAAPDVVFGYRYEIVAETPTRFRVLLEGRPAVNALVTAIRRDGTRLSARTNHSGRVNLPLSHGIWLVKTVALVPGETLWASLTFEQ